MAPSGPAAPSSQSVAPPSTQTTLRFARNVPGESSPIVLAADEVASWNESEQTIAVLLRGSVLISQGGIHVRCQQAVARFDLKYQRERGIWQMDLYAEGAVRIDGSAESKEAGRALVDLATRGEIKLISAKSKVSTTALSNDPFYRRAIAERMQDQSRSGVVPVGATSAPPSLTPITPTPSVAPAPPPTASPYGQPPMVPEPRSEAPAEIRHLAMEEPGREVRHLPFALVRAQAPDVPPPVATPVLPPPIPSGVVPGTSSGVVVPGAGRAYTVRPRVEREFSAHVEPLGTEQAVVVTGGVIINVRNVNQVGDVDLEADRLVIFLRGANAQEVISNLRQINQGTSHLEFYLAGHVEVREESRQPNGQITQRKMSCDEIYYDLDRNVAIALGAKLEMTRPDIPDPIVVRADEMRRLGVDTFEVTRGEVFASKLPSDPGLKVFFTTATIVEKTLPQVSLFGRRVINRATGEQLVEKEIFVKARNVFFEANDIPFFWWPYAHFNARHPLGPVENISAGFNNIFGAQVDVTWNMYELLGVQPYEGTRWRLMTDYLSLRGPALGTEFTYRGTDYFGLQSQHYEGFVKGFVINDDGTDNLGGLRPTNFVPPDVRGRFIWRQGVFDLPYGFTVLSQSTAVSDRNFLEQYFKRDWDTDLNQNSFLYVKQQADNWAWTGLVDSRSGRAWLTETQNVPRLDGWLLGLSFFDRLTYNAHANIGYFQLRRSSDNEPPVSPTDQNSESGRVDLMQEWSLPLDAGPVKVVPYAKLDLAYYTNDLNDQEQGRIWGGAGVRATLPLSRLYPDAQSELMNVNGIFHKIELTGNYFFAESNVSFTQFAQFDRFNDDAGDQSVRDARLNYPSFMPAAKANFISTSPLFDPQFYAVRRLVQTRTDTLDPIQVLQLNLNQRWQTKRGYPGFQHVVDWLTLDLGGSVFPNADRDNFGENLAFLEYDLTWNVGDRTAFTSSGWVDPIDQGAKVFTVGSFLNRPDRTSFYLGYRQIEPLQSRLIVGSVTYVFSPKYAMTASAAYDFGISKTLTNTLVATRVGTDLQLSLGVTYNSIQENFGLVFEIVPNLAANKSRRVASVFGSGSPLQ